MDIIFKSLLGFAAWFVIFALLIFIISGICDKYSKVKQTEPELGIKEPVISFVNTYKSNPKRFGIKVETTYKDYDVFKLYTLTDFVTGAIFSIEEIKMSGLGLPDYTLVKNCDFLTDDEIDYLFAEIRGFHTHRKAKVMSKWKERQRSRLIKTYCNTEDNK